MIKSKNIALNLSVKQISVLISRFAIIEKNPKPNTIEAKVARYVLDQVMDKMRKKADSKTKKLFLADRCAKLKISLELHEAYYLEKFADLVVSYPISEYDHNVLNFIKSVINKQFKIN